MARTAQPHKKAAHHMQKAAHYQEKALMHHEKAREHLNDIGEENVARGKMGRGVRGSIKEAAIVKAGKRRQR